MKRFFGTLVLLLVAIAVGIFAREYLVGVSVVAGDSMNDTLTTGDVALITRFDYISATPERGDVVQLMVPGRDGYYLKRVIGLPGDYVVINCGNVSVNGQPLYEPYATLSDDNYEITLGEDEYFVLGDNRPVSYDSREEEFGVVSAESFCGKVRAIVWPVERIEFGID